MTDYTQYLNPMLMAVGGLLQWVRSFKCVPDTLTIPIGAILAGAAYFLTSDWSLWASDPRLFVLNTILGTAAAVSTLFGGTFLVSRAASTASETAKANNFLVPATDSK